MKKMQQVIIGGLISLALSLIGAITAHAQGLDAIYVAPKMIFSKQTGDMESTTWTRSDGFSRSVLGGTDKDTNFGFGIALGNDFSYSTAYPVRVELEYVYHGDTEYSKGPQSIAFGNPAATWTASQSFKVKTHSLMVNGFFDIDLGSSFVPYVGGGLGMAYLKSSTISRLRDGLLIPSTATSSNDWQFAYNVGAGVSYAVSEQLALDLGYRYYDLGSANPGSSAVDFGNNTGRSGGSVDVTAHELSLALRFSGF